MPTGQTLASALRTIAHLETIERERLERARITTGTMARAIETEMYVSGMYRALAALYPVNGRTSAERAGDLAHHASTGRHYLDGVRVMPFDYTPESYTPAPDNTREHIPGCLYVETVKSDTPLEEYEYLHAADTSACPRCLWRASHSAWPLSRMEGERVTA